MKEKSKLGNNIGLNSKNEKSYDMDHQDLIENMDDSRELNDSDKSEFYDNDSVPS
jgi:hypothetical protein